MSSFAAEVNLHNLVQVYLMSCYLYEHRGLQVLDDEEFDEVCKWLDEEWEEIDHPHKSLINRDYLSTSSGFYLSEDDFPNRIKGAALHWHKNHGE